MVVSSGRGPESFSPANRLTGWTRRAGPPCPGRSEPAPVEAGVVEEVDAVDSQHGGQRVGMASPPGLGIEGTDAILQALPGNQAIHPLRQLDCQPRGTVGVPAADIYLPSCPIRGPQCANGYTGYPDTLGHSQGSDRGALGGDSARQYFHSGLRFWRKAVMPSWASSLRRLSTITFWAIS